MTVLPENVEPYHSTGIFNAQSVPSKLTAKHNTKRGVWGRIEAVSGVLRLTRCGAQDGHEQTETIPAGGHAIVAPEEVHFVTLDANSEFKVTFFRAAK